MKEPTAVFKAKYEPVSMLSLGNATVRASESTGFLISMLFLPFASACVAWQGFSCLFTNRNQHQPI